MEERTLFAMPEAETEHPIGERLARDEPPAHYTFKIGSFSLLTEILAKSKVGKYESGEFEVGGYKWKLLLYPDGDKKRNVVSYISLYLVIADSNKLQLGSEVNAFFRLFLYNQVRDKYLTFQGANHKPTRFHAMKTEHGFPKLISLTNFNDAAKGYLVDDCCIFGAEVFVANCTGKGESFSLIKDPHIDCFTWKIDNFSKIDKDQITSTRFTVNGLEWYLTIYPKGDSTRNSKSFSFFLQLEDHSGLGPGQKLYVEYKLRVKDQVFCNHYERLGQTWYCATNTGWGFSDFLPLSDLTNKSNRYIVEDTLIVEGQITLLSEVKKFPENCSETYLYQETRIV